MMNECKHRWHVVAHTMDEGQTVATLRAECVMGCYSTATVTVELNFNSIRHTYKTAEQFKADYDKHKPPEPPKSDRPIPPSFTT